MFSEIILVFLYLYPGALVDVFSSRLFPYSFKKDESSNFEKAARYFSFSIIISTISLLIYGRKYGDGVFNFNVIVTSLSGVFNLLYFVIISLIVTLIFTILSRCFGKFICFIRNLSVWKEWKNRILNVKIVSRFCEWRDKLQTDDVEIEVVDGWMQIVRGHDFDELGDNLIVSITNGDCTVAGYKYGWGDSFESGISLTRCDTVTKQLLKEQGKDKNEDIKIMPPKNEDIIIGASWGCYYDPKSNTFVHFYDGRKFR